MMTYSLLDISVGQTSWEGGRLNLDVGRLRNDLRAIDQIPLSMSENGKLLESSLESTLKLSLIVNEGLPFASCPLITGELFAQ